MGTPSISQALSGNFKKEETTNVKTPEAYAKGVLNSADPITQEKLNKIWPVFIERYSEQVHLYNTLTNEPQLLNEHIVQITVENSVQEDQIRQLKHELIGFLRRNLNNSSIDVVVELNRAKNENRMLTDEQKMKAMIQKNPALAHLRNKFNLDFNG